MQNGHRAGNRYHRVEISPALSSVGSSIQFASAIVSFIARPNSWTTPSRTASISTAISSSSRIEVTGRSVMPQGTMWR